MLRESEMKEYVLKLSVHAQHILTKISSDLSLGLLLGLTEEKVLAVKGAGDKVVREIIAFRDKCRTDEPSSIFPDEIPHQDEKLPAEALIGLSKRGRNVLKKNELCLTPRAICAWNAEKIAAMKGAGKGVVGELMAFRSQCRDGSIWKRIAQHHPSEETILPENYDALSDYVIAVMSRLCRVTEHYITVMRMNMGLLNVSSTRTLDATGKMLGGVTRERVRQIVKKLSNLIHSGEGERLFGPFVKVCDQIFSEHHYVISKDKFVNELQLRFPNWINTTAFSACQLLDCLDVHLEKNGSGCIACMNDGHVEKRYSIFARLLKDNDYPLEKLSQDYMLKHADSLALSGLSADEYLFFVHRAFTLKSKNERPRWDLYFRLRCAGFRIGDAERRRYAVANALRRAGAKGLSCPEIAAACALSDPEMPSPNDILLTADAESKQKYDMDGTGARLMTYDYADGGRPKRYTLNVYFKNKEIDAFLDDVGAKLRDWMESHAVGVVSIYKFRKELESKHSFPKAFGNDLPSACLYSLLRDRNSGGLVYFGHPLVAHPKIADKDGKIPEKAAAWAVFQYFDRAGRDLVTAEQLADFCTQILCMEQTMGANIRPFVKGQSYQVADKTYYHLVPPNDSMPVPNALCSDNVDLELSFSNDRAVGRDNVDLEGRPLSLNAYVRLFIRLLSKSGYSFTQEERANLADEHWCRCNLGISGSAFRQTLHGSSRPSYSYWRERFVIGRTKYWVYGRWNHKNKRQFDIWAKGMARKAGMVFEPYDIPCPNM